VFNTTKNCNDIRAKGKQNKIFRIHTVSDILQSYRYRVLNQYKKQAFYVIKSVKPLNLNVYDEKCKPRGSPAPQGTLASAARWPAGLGWERLHPWTSWTVPHRIHLQFKQTKQRIPIYFRWMDSFQMFCSWKSQAKSSTVPTILAVCHQMWMSLPFDKTTDFDENLTNQQRHSLPIKIRIENYETVRLSRSQKMY
jgi:hypothetical protein